MEYNVHRVTTHISSNANVSFIQAESALRLLEPDLQIKIKKWQEKYNGLPGTAKDFAYVVTAFTV